ncbi:hypothetical protein [Arenibacter algicola]|uniref:hypothetical protein n=1 Tax=Arenibacter algicola TaxID=616991 RepID=UPI0004DFC1E7|nr:hypothetical protein [Arenibacter algicola]
MGMRLDVEFYNDEERDLLKLNYPREFEKLEKIVEKGYVIVPFSDFKTYSQMHHRNPSLSKLNSFNSIQGNVGDLYGNVNFYTQFDQETGRFYAEYSTVNEQNHVSESIGCGGALSVLGSAYGLTQADWQRIDIQNHKDFDFDSAVIDDFSKMIVIESKGSIVEDNTIKEKVSSHKNKIKKKKRDAEFKKKYEKGTDLLIGLITVVDTINHTKVLLVDPPAESNQSDMFRFKIKVLKRLIFYFDWMSIISSRSYLSITLNNRIRVLKKLEDIRILDLVELTNTDGELLKLKENFIKTKSHIDEEIVGRLHIINEKKAVFIGLHVEIYNHVASQDFFSISKFKTNTYIKTGRINLKLSRLKAESANFIKNITIEYRKGSSELIHFNVNDAMIFQNSAGLVYSILTNKNNYSILNE